MLPECYLGLILTPRSIKALARDGYHCMVTNSIDANSFEKHEAIKKLQSDTGAAVRIVQTCHIFNESILQNIEPDDEYPQQPRVGISLSRLI